MRIWRRAAALLLALCMTVLLAACGEDPNDEKKLSVVMTGAVHTMDPAQVSTAAERTVVQHVFENLMRLNADGTVSHALACSYTQETALDGSVTYTFQLRTDAKWSDGTAVTAAISCTHGGGWWIRRRPAPMPTPCPWWRGTSGRCWAIRRRCR